MSGHLKIAGVPLSLLALYSIVGFWLLPAWMQKQVGKIDDKGAFEYTRVEKIRFNPINFVLRDFATEADSPSKIRFTVRTEANISFEDIAITLEDFRRESETREPAPAATVRG